MMERIRTIGNDIFTRIANASRREWIVSICTIVGGALIAYLILNFGIVSVKVETSPSQENTKIKYINPTSQSTYPALGSFVIVPRSEKSLTVQMGNYATITQTLIPWYGYASSTAKIEIDKNADKYTVTQDRCLFYTQEADEVATYNCERSSEFTINQQGDRNPSTAIPDNSSIAPYREGVIGITSNTNSPRIFYQRNDGSVTYYPFPKAISSNDAAFAEITTDHTNNQNNRFIITTLTGHITVGTLTDTTPAYTSIEPPKDWNSMKASRCQLVLDTAYCHQGISTEAPGAGDGPSESTPGTLIKIDITSNDKISTTRYTTSKDLTVDKIAVINPSSIVLKSSTFIYLAKIKGGTVESEPFTDNVDDLAFSSTANYFVKGGAVYKIDEKTKSAYAVFSSPKLTVKKLIVDKNTVFIGAEQNSEAFGFYKLNNTANDGPVRLVDMIPINYDNNPLVSSIDYLKNTIYVQVKVSINKSARTSAEAVNATEYNKVKQQVLDKLHDEGIDTSKYEIKFSY